MNAALSVCIPVLNEAAHLPRLLRLLKAQQDVALEIVVADGGSTDASLAGLPAGVTAVTAPRGRGAQMNAAARAATGNTLLFLHADSQLPGPRLLATALAELDAARRRLGHDRVAGHFPLRFARRGFGHALAYRYLEEKTALSRPGTINGDQGLLLSRRFFESLGGFDTSLPFLEDQRIAARIQSAGAWITLPGALITSARRFEALGFARVYMFMAIIMTMLHAGGDEFVAAAPALYQRRLADGRLDMRAVFHAFRRMQRSRPLSRRLRLHFDAGRYARDNVWQLFFFLDVAARPLPGPRYPLLRVYDRAFARLLRNAVVDALLGGLNYISVLIILRAWYTLHDRAG